ncbi:MAG: hypothetical protein AAF205_03615 [Pseudomonadota bacterium]
MSESGPTEIDGKVADIAEAAGVETAGVEAAMARLDAAIARFDAAASAAASRAASAATAESDEAERLTVLTAERDLLALKHRRLLQESEGALGDLDRLIAGMEG